MVTVGMNYEVRAGKEGIFEEGFRKVLGVMQGSDGHVRSRLYRDIDSAGSYLIHSEWRDKESFSAFIKSPTFADVTRWGSMEILAGRPSHRIYGE